MRTLILTTAIALAAMLTATDAGAQTESNYGAKAYLGPHLGIQKAQDSDDPNYLVGATLRLRLMSVLGAEGTFSYRQQKFGDEAVTVRSWPLTVTGLLYPLPIIYGGLGGGWYHTTYDYNDSWNDLGFGDETDQQFGWHLAAGAELPLGQSARLAGDVRYVFLDQEFKDLPRVFTDDDVNADFYAITLALLFQL